MKSKLLIFTAFGLLVTAAILVRLRITKAGFVDVRMHHSSHATGAKIGCDRVNLPDSRLKYRRVDRPDSVRDSRHVLREKLFSDDPSARIEAALKIAALNDEDAFKTIAECIAKMEATGDAAHDGLTAELSRILSTMRGEELIHVATEYAYAPSRVVAEAATNVVVGIDGNEVFVDLDSETSESEQQEQAQLIGELLQEGK